MFFCVWNSICYQVVLALSSGFAILDANFTSRILRLHSGTPLTTKKGIVVLEMAPHLNYPAPRPCITKRYVAIAGNIGVGKSTFVEFLSHTFGLKPVFEPHADNPYLEDFYTDMNRWSLPSQAYFLGRKFRLHREAQDWPVPVVQDRTIYEDAEVFARNLFEQGFMDERDFRTYWELYCNIRDSLRPPDLLIFLKADLKTIRKRIRMRGRKMEENIPMSYLKRLSSLYDDWYESYSLSPTLTITTNKIDYITDMVDRIDILKEIEKHLM